MKKFNTQGIILARTNFGEADRILTFLTPDHGKVRAMAKGVRKTKSKLAGGIELFSVSELSFMVGRSEILPLVSSRLVKHYGDIVKDLDRTNLGYEFIKILNKATEEQPEEAYFNLLKAGFEALNDETIDLGLIEAWFGAQMLKLAGHSPNLRAEKSGQKLVAGQKYDFNFESMCFEPGKTYNSDQIKFLRLLFSGNLPQTIQKIHNSEALAKAAGPLVNSALRSFVRV
jgi:DNA repair protein RecO (recombination protein O)